MIKWFSDPIPELVSCALTMGNFDGLHLGHVKVLETLKDKATELGLPAVVLTYWEHPGHYVHLKHQVPILTPRSQKKQSIMDGGIENVFFINFTTETAHASATEFLQEVIIGHFHPKLIVAGYDTHFGYRREGNAEFLQSQAGQYGYAVEQVEPVWCGDKIISSSLIREALQAGDAKTARAMLGKPYSLYGKVSHGQKLGRVIGFPTINLNSDDIEQLIPKNGVYLSKVILAEHSYFGLTNIGTSPTLKNNGQVEIETFILDFKRDIYEQSIRLDLLEYLRQEKHFSNSEELIRAIRQDIALGKELMAGL